MAVAIGAENIWLGCPVGRIGRVFVLKVLGIMTADDAGNEVKIGETEEIPVDNTAAEDDTVKVDAVEDTATEDDSTGVNEVEWIVNVAGTEEATDDAELVEETAADEDAV